MDNKSQVQDLLDKAEKYRKDHLQPKVKSQEQNTSKKPLTEEESKAISKFIRKVFHYTGTNRGYEKVVIGKTKNGNLITVCISCKNYHIPHFNYEGKKQKHTFSLLSEELIDSQNIDIELRTDVEEFLNEIVTVKKIQKTNKLIGKLNKKSIKQFKTRYFGINTKCIKNDMNYWDLVIKVWNELNEEKTPKNLKKPYYLERLNICNKKKES